ncbi:sialoadhesin-like [Salminus brasiliensis]|uniref:sialoadhesin-like n=1 Tax=Salminus brasiliensis TaxID=930266 RepID=UPI003B83882F
MYCQILDTDLQVKVDPQTVGQRQVKLTCSSSCSLGTNLYYYWFRNGQHRTSGYDASIVLDSTRPSGVLGKQCWGVTYTAKRVCALKGSSVDLSCSYKYPGGHTVTKSVWFIKEQSGAEPVDLREDEEYQGRVQNRQSSQNDCSMRIADLRERDTQTYRFRFYTDDPGGKYTGRPGVSLSVTDLKITVSCWSEQTVTLICSSTCTLPNNPTYIWYKNGQSESHCRSASCSVAVVSGAVNYSCAVEGHESLLSPPVYSPRNTRAVLLPSGEREEGESVTLSCSSDADPPVLSYSWFKQRAAADTPLTTGQNYSITNISSQHSGLYYCTAHNQLGHHSSTPVHLDVKHSPRNTRAVLLPSGERVEGESVTLSCSSDADPPVLSYSWFKQRAAADTPLTTGQNYSITNISSQHSELYYCTAHNQLGHHSSTPVHLDVLYPPSPPSVSESVSGDSVTLVCVSDSNPHSSFSWYRKTGSDVMLVGNSSNLTLTAGEVGGFYCKAENPFGSHNSSEWSFPSSGNTAVKYAASGVTVLLLLTFTAALLRMRRRAAASSSRREENSTNCDSSPVYGNISALTVTPDPTVTAVSDDQDEVQYSSVHFRRSHTQEASLFSTVQQPSALNQDEEVEYSTVKLIKPQTSKELFSRSDETTVYSTVRRT